MAIIGDGLAEEAGRPAEVGADPMDLLWNIH